MTEQPDLSSMSDIRAQLVAALKESPQRRWGRDACEQIADVLLSLPGIATVALPEPTDRGQFTETEGGWISFPEGTSATVPEGRVFDQDADISPSEARALGASLLAAANAAERAVSP